MLRAGSTTPKPLIFDPVEGFLLQLLLTCTQVKRCVLA